MSTQRSFSKECNPLNEGLEVLFPETDFYVLEKDLMTKTSIQEVFVAVTRWIVTRIECNYLIFSADGNQTTEQIKYFYSHKNVTVFPEKILEERLISQVSVDSVFIHPSGGVSIPFSFGAVSIGHMYIGFRLTRDTTSFFTKRKLLPIARILGRSLLYLETETVREEKNKLQYAFSHYVSPDVVQNIIDNPAMMNLGGEKQFLSVVFTDLKDFTSLSENMDPVILVKVLNLYLNEMSQVIISLGGTIDKFEGDAIMAFFGAPNKFTDHAVRCCLAALRMKRMENLINTQLLAEELITEPLFTRIGVNSGDMVVGNIGSVQRLDYTIIGKNVNIASRIETANKKYGTSILISESTYNLIKNFFECRFVEASMLKGFSEPIKIYELLTEYENTALKYSDINSMSVDNLPFDEITSVSNREFAELEEL